MCMKMDNWGTNYTVFKSLWEVAHLFIRFWRKNLIWPIMAGLGYHLNVLRVSVTNVCFELVGTLKFFCILGLGGPRYHGLNGP